MKFLECCNLQWENGEQSTNGDGEQPHREHNGGVANTKINGSDLEIHLFTSYCIFLSQDHLDPKYLVSPKLPYNLSWLPPLKMCQGNYSFSLNGNGKWKIDMFGTWKRENHRIQSYY